MTGMAIEVDLAGLGFAIGRVGFAFMAVRMMAKVKRGHPLLVLAIGARCGPGELERNEY
jgi:hypothetical protein